MKVCKNIIWHGMMCRPYGNILRLTPKARNLSFACSVSLFALILISSLVIPSFLPEHSSAAETNANDPAISIVPAGGLTIDSIQDADANHFAKGTVNVGVSTTSSAGYTLSMNTSTNNNSLINTKDPTKKIDSITTEKTKEQFQDNTWGYSLGNDTNFKPIPTLNSPDEDKQIAITDTAGSNQHNINFGAKLSNDLISGRYTNTVIFSATSNTPPGITLTFDANGGNFSGAPTNVLLYTVPEVISYPADTKTTSSTTTTSASGTHKTSINDTSQYASNSNYYQDLTLNTNAPGPYDLTIYYATESVSYDWICVFDGTSYTPGSEDACTDASAVAPATNTGGTTTGNKIGGPGSGKTAYAATATFKVNSKTARIYFHSDGSANSYGFWAEFTGGGDVVTQNLISGTYIAQPSDRSGYVFLGWATTPNATEPNWTYDPNAIVNENTTVYAVWVQAKNFDQAFAAAGKSKQSGYYKMQDMTSAICAAVQPYDNAPSTQLIDTRSGNEVYTIKKLKDGKCWMTENLRLGGTNSITLHNTDTNMSALDWTLPASGTSNFTSSTGYTTAAMNADYKTTNQAASGSSPAGKIGNYYNYCAASAGTYCAASGSGTGDAEHDICPKGWRMPTGGSSGEYQALYTAYSSNVANFQAALVTPLSGRFYSGSAGYQGSSGNFWSSTRYDGRSMYNLYVNSSSVYPTDSSGRYYGYSVRCVAQ